MQARVDVRAAERDEMAARVKRAKESYEAEALRKQHELHDVEATLARLGEQNHNLTSCVGQVREQISPYISPASRSYLPCISLISPGARADLGAGGGDAHAARPAQERHRLRALRRRRRLTLARTPDPSPHP